MRPLKGMMRDVHPSKVSEGLYIDAVNFVYGEHMDSLLQEAGFTNDSSVQDDSAPKFYILGGCGLVDDGIILFCKRPDSTTNYVVKVVGTLTTILSSGVFGFSDTAVIDAVSFKTTSGQTFVILTDDVSPPKYLNVDTTAVPSLVSPTHDPVYIEQNQVSLGGQGFFNSGTHYIAIAYAYEDESYLEFNNLNGPYVVYDSGKTISLKLSNLDSDYSYIAAAFVSVYDDSVSTGITGFFPYEGNETTITLTGILQKDISLDEILVQNIVYSQAKTLTLQGNRLYMGNVATADVTDLQQYANRIQVLYQTYYGGHTEDGVSTVGFNGNDKEQDLNFGGLAFQPGEVYAFYVSYVREDGSLTPAFHIPGPPPRTIGQPHLTAVETGASGTIRSTDASLIAANSNLSYLEDDNDIAASGMKYFHTRNTHEYFGDASAYTPASVTSGVGVCGYWENSAETYPSNFPVQQWTVEDTSDNSGSITDYTLASEPVRHHKIPILGDATDLVRIRFANVPMPAGYVGVRMFHAKRDLTNSLHIGQSILIHGSYNHYSNIAETVTDYHDYTSSHGMNLPQYNSQVVSDTDTISSATDQLNNDAWFTGIKETTGRMYCFEALRSRVNLPETAYIENIDYRIDYGLSSTGEVGLIGDGLITDNSDNGYWGDSDILNAPNALTVGGKAFFPENGRQVNLTNSVRIRKVSTVRYVETNAIDDELEIDNRFCETCIGFNIEYANSTSSTDWKDFLKSTSGTHLGNTSNPGTGFRINSNLTAGHTGSQASNPIWITNLKQHLFTCYQNYAAQDLVACTGVIPYTKLASAELGQIDGEDVDVGSIDTTFVVGDIVRSFYKHRLTAPVGVDAEANGNSPTDLVDLLLSNEVTTVDSTRGILSQVYNYRVQGRTKFEYLNYELDNPVNLSDNEYVFRAASPGNDQLYDYPSRLYAENVYQPVGIFSSGQTFVNDFPHRIVRSSEIGSLGVSTNVIAFKPIEFFDMQRDRGEIENLQGYGDRLIIHHERGLFMTQGQEKISTTAGNLALGQSDILATKPVEIRPSDKGYAGTQHLLSCVLTPHGYFFVDADQRKVFSLAGTDLKEISRSGMKDWFQEKLNLDTTFSSSNTFKFFPGVHATYDSRYDRVILLIRNADYTGDFTAGYLIDTQDEYNDNAGIDSKDEFISYSYLNQAWVSRHTYDSTALLEGLNTVYALRVRNIDIDGTLSPQVRSAKFHNQSGTFGKFHGVVHESTIDASSPIGQAGVFSSFNWDTRVVTFPEERFTHYENTFTKALVYTDTHCSGFIDLVVPEGLTTGHNLRHTHERWHFNGFRDLVADRSLPFLTEDLELIDTNISSTLQWYEQRRIQSDYAVIRLYIKSSDTGQDGIGLYLYDISAKVRPTARG